MDNTGQVGKISKENYLKGTTGYRKAIAVDTRG